jgi:hypothetical protein
MTAMDRQKAEGTGQKAEGRGQKAEEAGEAIQNLELNTQHSTLSSPTPPTPRKTLRFGHWSR